MWNDGFYTYAEMELIKTQERLAQQQDRIMAEARYHIADHKAAMEAQKERK